MAGINKRLPKQVTDGLHELETAVATATLHGERDVQTHFGTLQTMYEDLASMGHAPVEDNFYAIVIGSLPPSYDPFVSALNTTSSVVGSFLTPDNLMQSITDEYDHRTLAGLPRGKKMLPFMQATMPERERGGSWT